MAALHAQIAPMHDSIRCRPNHCLHCTWQPVVFRLLPVRFQGHMFAERTKKSGQLESAVVVPGSLLGCAAYLSSTKTRAVIRTAEPCKLVAFGPHELEKLLVTHQPLAHVAKCCACFVFPYVEPIHCHGGFADPMLLRLTSHRTTPCMLSCCNVSAFLFLCYWMPASTARPKKHA